MCAKYTELHKWWLLRYMLSLLPNKSIMPKYTFSKFLHAEEKGEALGDDGGL